MKVLHRSSSKGKGFSLYTLLMGSCVITLVTFVMIHRHFHTLVAFDSVVFSLPTTTHQCNNMASQFPSLHCPSFLASMKAGTHPHQVDDPNNGTQYTTRTITTHPFWWSVHRKEYDLSRWKSFQQGVYYERVQGQAWQNILLSHSEPTIVLDVGGNIGYYALLTASWGHVVHSFEPNLVNVLRFCESILLNQWDDCRLVHVHPLGISDHADTLPFYVRRNPGAGTFEVQPQRSPRYTLPVVPLDTFVQEQGWFQTRPTLSILKVDVEGHESAVLLGAPQLLHSHLVQHILVEARMDAATRPALQLLYDAGYHLYKVGSKSGPDTFNPIPHTDQLIHHMFTNTSLLKVTNKYDKYVNMWWKLPTAPAL
jgi:FkbM family methyltransferase